MRATWTLLDVFPCHLEKNTFYQIWVKSFKNHDVIEEFYHDITKVASLFRDSLGSLVFGPGIPSLVSWVLVGIWEQVGVG